MATPYIHLYFIVIILINRDRKESEECLDAENWSSVSFFDNSYEVFTIFY